MADLKTDFQNWLIKQGCKERTNKGRPSTVYEYCKRIDRLCDKLYGNHSTDKWEALAVNIGKILISYYECCNKEYYINQYNAKDALLYFNDIKHNSLDNDLFQASVSLVYNGNKSLISEASFSQIDEYLKIFDFCLEQMANDTSQDIDIILGFYCISNSGSSNLVSNFLAAYPQCQNLSFSDASIHIQYNNQCNAKTKSALMRYYEFLQAETDSSIVVKLKNERDNNEIKLCIAKVEKVTSKTNLFYIEVGQFANEYNPKTVVPRKDSFTGKNSDFLGIQDSADSLECSPKTFKRIVKNQYKKKNEKFSLNYNDNRKCTNFEDIQTYLEEHHHPSGHTYQAGTYNAKSKNNWCTAPKAAEIIGCSVSTVIQYRKDGELSYTDYTPRHVLYFIPDVERIRDERKQNGRRKKKY